MKYLPTTLRHSLWRGRGKAGKTLVIVSIIISLLLSTMYGIGYWYQQSQKDVPFSYGATFVDNYAEELGVDPRETLQASIDELGIKRYRLVSYWKDHEPAPDNYDFSDLDWQFDMIEAAGGEVTLALGLRQPRWPECHGPAWAMEQPISVWTEDLLDYIEVVVNRYKDRAVLVDYQLENEFFLQVFGECPDFSRERLEREFDLVRQLDPTRPINVNRSNNATPSWPVQGPKGDSVGMAVYKRVWDRTITKRYVEYPLPPWFYSFIAGATELFSNRPSFIHELQTEAWLPDGFSMSTAPLDELYKSFGPGDLTKRLQYARDTGIRHIDLWGVEWWYHLKENRNAPELWNEAFVTFNQF